VFTFGAAVAFLIADDSISIFVFCPTSSPLNCSFTVFTFGAAVAILGVSLMRLRSARSAVAGENKYHKFCFKCSVCGITLSLKNSQQKGDQIFCAQHVPKEVPTATADRADLNRIKEGPKIATVNQQFRGELVGQKPNIDMESAAIKNATAAPKIDTVNQQFRGELVGQKSNIDMESSAIKNATAAPKVNTVNEQFRGELVGQKTNIDMESAAIKNATAAPKVNTVNEQFRGELVGQKTNLDMESHAIKNATAAPKLEVEGGVKKGDQNLEPVKGEIYHC